MKKRLNMMAENRFFLVLLLLLLLLTGCSDKVRLKGKVVYSDDKSPVTAGTVCFEKETYLARGNINPDGTFVMGSFENNDGLPPGKYRIRIVGAIKVIGQNKDGSDKYEPLIDQKFTSASTSGITFDVTPSTKFFEVVVDRFNPKQKPLRKQCHKECYDYWASVVHPELTKIINLQGYCPPCPMVFFPIKYWASYEQIN